MNKHEDTTILNSSSRKTPQLLREWFLRLRDYITDKNKLIDTGPIIIFILALILLGSYKVFF